MQWVMEQALIEGSKYIHSLGATGGSRIQNKGLGGS